MTDTESTSAALARVTAERDEALATLDHERAELAEAEATVTNFSFGYDKILADLTNAMRERNEARALLAEAYASQQGEYAEPGCCKRTGNASNRCLRALNHPGPCDDNPPLTSVIQNAIRERDEACAETLRLAAARSWIVARDGGRECVRCDQKIRRGEAYDLLPGTDETVHICCPRPTPHLDAVKAELAEAREEIQRLDDLLAAAGWVRVIASPTTGNPKE